MAGEQCDPLHRQALNIRGELLEGALKSGGDFNADAGGRWYVREAASLRLVVTKLPVPRNPRQVPRHTCDAPRISTG